MKLCALTLALALVAGCNTIRAGSDSDSEIDFSRYQTWAFAERIPEVSGQPRPGQPPSPLDNRRIERAIREYLVGRQVPEVLRADADIIVAYYLQFDENIQISNGHSVSPYGYYYSYPRARRQTKGTLVIDLVDPKEQQIVWHGYAFKTIYEDARDADAEIRRAVELVLERYPE